MYDIINENFPYRLTIPKTDQSFYGVNKLTSQNTRWKTYLGVCSVKETVGFLSTITTMNSSMDASNVDQITKLLHFWYQEGES